MIRRALAELLIVTLILSFVAVAILVVADGEAPAAAADVALGAEPTPAVGELAGPRPIEPAGGPTAAVVVELAPSEGRTPAVEAAASAAPPPDDGEPLEVAPILPSRAAGVVRANGEAVPGAVVRLVQRLPDGGLVPVDSRSGVTDRNGRFDLGARPPAEPFEEVAVVVAADGWRPVAIAVRPFGQQLLHVDLPVGLTVEIRLDGLGRELLADRLIALDDDRILSGRFGRGRTSLSVANDHYLATGGLPSSPALPVVRTDREGRARFRGMRNGESHRFAVLDPVLAGDTSASPFYGSAHLGARPVGTVAVVSVDVAADGRAPLLEVHDVELLGVDADAQARRYSLHAGGESLRSALGWLDIAIRDEALAEALASGALEEVALSLDVSIDRRPLRQVILALAGGGPMDSWGSSSAYYFGPVPPAAGEVPVDGRLRLRITNPTGGAPGGTLSFRARYGETVLEPAPWRMGDARFDLELRSGEGQLEVVQAHAHELWPPVVTRVEPGFEQATLDLVVNDPGSLSIERPRAIAGQWEASLWAGGFGTGTGTEPLLEIATSAPSVYVPALPPGPWTVVWGDGDGGELDRQSVAVAPAVPTIAQTLRTEPAAALPSDG